MRASYFAPLPCGFEKILVQIDEVLGGDRLSPGVASRMAGRAADCEDGLSLGVQVVLLA